MSTRIVILAAGKGKRMGAAVPKPLVEISGRAMIEHLLDSVRDSGIDDKPILVVAPDTLEHFYRVCDRENCDYAVQEEQLGTGHAVQSAQNAASDAEGIIVLYGDHPFISAELMQTLQKAREESDAVLVAVTVKVPNFNKDYQAFYNWGRIVRDDAKRIVRSQEMKDATPEELEIKEVNAGIYCFDAEWLWEHLPELRNQNASEEYYLTDLIGMAIEEGEDVKTISAEPFEVIGINTPEELKRAEEILGA